MNLRFIPLLLPLFIYPVSGMKPIISAIPSTFNVTLTSQIITGTYISSIPIFLYQSQFVPQVPQASISFPTPLLFLSAAAVLITVCIIQRGFTVTSSRRDTIYDFIVENSGCQESQIVSALGFSRGSVTHHLHKLEQTNHIISTQYHGTPRYYPKSSASLSQAKLAAALSRKRPAEIYRLISENPDITQRELAKISGLSEQTIRWHVKRLETDGIIQCRVEGKVKRYRIL
ncbi:MAG TPA: winged helix-turn-helix transcriptional regulator [Methanocorpusculum sp.]|nr:winged helix-turn-helix transcriptional regulator [Methanocorpusculum sp.]HJJ81301.1 winged helix-turn-helix transcriptional regulator [Methanocorpusculum sp.]